MSWGKFKESMNQETRSCVHELPDNTKIGESGDCLRCSEEVIKVLNLRTASLFTVISLPDLEEWNKSKTREF